MSRGFVKEDDQEEAPFVPPRAALPAGVENLVTPEGFEALKAERFELNGRRKLAAEMDERDRRREHAILDQLVIQLEDRINSARVIEPIENPNEVRFGTTVTYAPIRRESNAFEFKIVGVDEANIKAKKIAFVAPIVQNMMGKKIGEIFSFLVGEIKLIIKS